MTKLPMSAQSLEEAEADQEPRLLGAAGSAERYD